MMDVSGRTAGAVADDATLVGVDVGGTKIAAVLMRGGRILDSVRIPTRHGNGAVVEGIRSVVTTLTAGSPFRPAAVGIGIPGRVDHRRGTVQDAVNLGVRRLDLSSELERHLGLPVHVENDVNAAALGEAALAYPNLRTVAVLNAGTGLAAGVIRGGRIDHGAHGTVGEVGHVPVDPHRLPCACGQRGCLETVASGSAVLRMWPEGGSTPMSSLLGEAESGNPRAREVLDVVLGGLSTAVLLLAMTVDPDVIVISGGMAAAGAPLLSAVRDRLRARSSSSAFLDSLKLDERVALADSQMPWGAVGAALSASAALHCPEGNGEGPDMNVSASAYRAGTPQEKENTVGVPDGDLAGMEAGCD